MMRRLVPAAVADQQEASGAARTVRAKHLPAYLQRKYGSAGALHRPQHVRTTMHVFGPSTPRCGATLSARHVDQWSSPCQIWSLPPQCSCMKLLVTSIPNNCSLPLLLWLPGVEKVVRLWWCSAGDAIGTMVKGLAQRAAGHGGSATAGTPQAAAAMAMAQQALRRERQNAAAASSSSVKQRVRGVRAGRAARRPLSAAARLQAGMGGIATAPFATTGTSQLPPQKRRDSPSAPTMLSR